MHKLKYIKDGIKIFVAYCIANILKISKSNRDIWLIGERKDEARDNGYHLFKYIRENHHEDKVYYVIDRTSRDLKKIQNLGNIIYSNTFKHYLYYALANKLVIAHLGSCVPDSPVCWKIEGLKIIKPKRAFIQHGITISSNHSLMYNNTKADLFICGAKKEYDFIKTQFGYPLNNVKYTGFARFDNLYNYKEKNQILIMPTWRQWIPSTTWSDNNRECEEIFLKSEYYKKFNELINDEEINRILNCYDINLILYPHHEMQKYVGLFKTSSERIVIANENEFEVQELLKESKILITDYSSVAFDFAYMNKSIIYYQFDKEKYYNKHYTKGYYDYEEFGFGPIVKDLNMLKKQLVKIICTKTDKKYTNRINTFFGVIDRENCKRNYENITKI